MILDKKSYVSYENKHKREGVSMEGFFDNPEEETGDNGGWGGMVGVSGREGRQGRK